MRIITPPSHVLVMKFRITAGKLLNFVTLWIDPGIPLDPSAFSELFEAFVAVLESYRTWGFCGNFSFHLLKAERKRLKHGLLTGSFTTVHTALRIFSESLKYFFFLQKVKILSSFFP